MLSGLRDIGGSMLPRIMGDMSFEPNAEDMERAADAVRFNKIVKFKSYNVKTFDTSDEKDRIAYAKLMLELQEGVQASTHVIWYQDRKFVESTAPRWLIHLEWAEYELKVEPVNTLGTPAL